MDPADQITRWSTLIHHLNVLRRRRSEWQSNINQQRIMSRLTE